MAYVFDPQRLSQLAKVGNGLPFDQMVEAVIDATLNPAACVGNWCGNVLANGAGSTGTLTIDGAGSVVRTLRSRSSPMRRRRSSHTHHRHRGSDGSSRTERSAWGLGPPSRAHEGLG